MIYFDERILLVKKVLKSEMQIISKMYSISKIHISESLLRRDLTKVKGSPIAGYWLCWKKNK